MTNRFQGARAEIAILCGLIVLAFAFRLVHLGGPLDEPMWRQADTAYMAYRMMDESPPDLLRPKAPYRGTNDVKAAEFPIYPATVALAYKALGRESLPAARAVTLLYFFGALVFAGMSVALLTDRRTGWHVAAAYALLPQGIFYSRAVHPDFSIIFFSHLFLYAGLRFFRGARWNWYGWAVVAATAAFLMKAPYCFYFGLPLAACALAVRSGWTWRNLIALGFVFVIPLASALWFNQHRIDLESGFEQSVVYPWKWTPGNLQGRFFGTLADRFDPDAWRLLARRILFSVTGPTGALLAAAGLWQLYRRGRGWPSNATLLALFAGFGLYALAMFRMMTRGHDYYSLPLLLPAAILIGLAIARFDAPRSPRRLVLALLAWVFVGGGVVAGLQRGPYLHSTNLPFFSVDWQFVRAAEVIERETRSEELVLVLTHGRSTGPVDPRILTTAHRRGWANQLAWLNPGDVDRYREAGAAVAAVVVTAHPGDKGLAHPHLDLSTAQAFPLDPPATGAVLLVRFPTDTP